MLIYTTKSETMIMILSGVRPGGVTNNRTTERRLTIQCAITKTERENSETKQKNTNGLNKSASRKCVCTDALASEYSYGRRAQTERKKNVDYITSRCRAPPPLPRLHQ